LSREHGENVAEMDAPNPRTFLGSWTVERPSQKQNAGGSFWANVRKSKKKAKKLKKVKKTC
jgi:hypothetical protein